MYVAKTIIFTINVVAKAQRDTEPLVTSAVCRYVNHITGVTMFVTRWPGAPLMLQIVTLIPTWGKYNMKTVLLCVKCMLIFY